MDKRGTIEQIFGSIFEPGVPPAVFTVINYSLVALILYIVSMLTLGGWWRSDAAIHLFVFLVLAVGLWGSVQYFLYVLTEAQEQEKKNPKPNSENEKDK